jgi:hypothetical protein
MESKEAKVWAVIDLILDSIREAGQQGIPSGHLYTILMTHWPALSLEPYQNVITLLVKTKKITNKNHLLVAIK